MLKFRLWCFLNKIMMIKVSMRYKKMIKSGAIMDMGVLCDSIPQKNKKENVDSHVMGKLYSYEM